MKDIKDIEFSVDGLKLKGNLFYPDKINEKNPTSFYSWMDK